MTEPRPKWSPRLLVLAWLLLLAGLYLGVFHEVTVSAMTSDGYNESASGKPFSCGSPLLDVSESLRDDPDSPECKRAREPYALASVALIGGSVTVWFIRRFARKRAGLA
jgi:hypothetical protein